MNLVNLFGNKSKLPEPEYFLAIEIHESLIKTALWEVLEGQPEVVNVGSYESWADEESLINGVDSSLDQAIKVIKGQPKRVVFGLPASWMEDEKIHSTKTKLVTRLCKELGLEPIGAVTTNRAIAHFLKKREGMPPTVILLEVYTSKVAVSYVYLGAVNKTEEVARSGDLAHDVEEGLTRMDLNNYPARFILTNGNGLEEESQQITAFPWTDRLPFKHIPKVEILPIDFSIKAIALTGGIEAVQSIGFEIKEAVEESNLVVPEKTPSSMEELGFSYEETAPPPSISLAEPVEPSEEDLEPKYAFSGDEIGSSPQKKFHFKIALPSLPKINLPHPPRLSYLLFLVIPAILFLGLIAYLFLGQVEIAIHFNPQKVNRQLGIAIAETLQESIPTLIATKKTFSGSAQESISTTGTATVGDKATGTITIGNKSSAPLILKAGSTVSNDTGKYSYILQTAVTIASASADSLDTISGKATGVQVTATKIGAEHNLLKGTIFSVDSFSKAIAVAVSESDFAGGTSRTVNAVSKVDQDKLLATGTEKIKIKVQSDAQMENPELKTLPLSDIIFTKKQFDHNLSEEATTVSLTLEGSFDALVYSQGSLNDLATNELKSQIPAGSYIKKESTTVSLENPTKSGGIYQSKVMIEASLYPEIDEQKLAEFIKGKSVSGLRHFFEPIPGFTGVNIKIFPSLPFITKILPLRNIKFDLVSN
ncbi:MAG: hypothetical protein UX08_C0007G0087 [Candidatus Collierbacteria bacterium GW2011_GWB1_45_35]|uniref:Baseplate protein J-like domain-containing protein n=2 Tax=Candidatus Collieribacteriota TaxID=1752725 RepID=A0A837IHT6_9BACT|nr:MAG: hypothetical protein UW48_C0001G0022 [Microgenomates group bacterium GW2011_GWC1_44_23]KKT96142.1 MAG: hypothetical protein UW96_C0001G0020 [Candidatus Collierbacteria bacterium GW2011_GWA1_45_15]KKU01182.1 MAG: hypothetical protein UX01_C0001G0026 [Candidatus Collierbacteria bacterium GW2011_GWB2_45_17]KKU05390.1 MAG: hypothetical protein UX08_C0007G0087 [Candidatus Collierbacteria bacterium GW2011_GWB1_45_35]KKU06751.1 MAG: hypothetical protein UX11_C0028G0004 [Candidatus Collierbacte